MARNPLLQTALLALTVIFGLSTRKYGAFFPDSIASYGGDTLYAVMTFFLAGLLFRKMSTVNVAAFALLFCYLIEITQLYHTPWIDAVRANRLGGIVLGFGFLWSDIMCYTVGVGAAGVLEYLLMGWNRKK